MKLNITKTILLAANCLLLTAMSSCTRIDLEDMPDPTPPTPTTGSITLVTDWTNRTEGIAIPPSYTAVVDGKAYTLNKTSHVLTDVDAGTYSAIVYNSADKITVTNTTAIVATANNIIDNKPEWLFTHACNIVCESGKDNTQTLLMVQQIRQLSIDITITGGNSAELQSVTASLTGVANGMNFETNTYTGTGLNVIPILAKESNKLTGSVRLLGLTAEVQKLTFDLKFSDGKGQIIETDISNKLIGFNHEKYKIMTLTANMEIANKAGFEATINQWNATTGSSGIAW